MAERTRIALYCGVAAALSLLASVVASRGIFGLTHDSIVYISESNSLFSGKGISETTYFPGYSFHLGLVAKLVGSPVFAGRIVSVVASASTVVPLMLLVRRFFDLKIALLTALLYILLPFRLQLSNMVWSDALCLAYFSWGTWLALGGDAKFGVGRSLGIGALFGLAFITQAYGIFVFATLVVVSIVGRKWWCVPNWRALGLASVVVLAFVVPYSVFLHQHLGRWTLSGKTSGWSVQGALAKGVPYEKIMRLDPTGTKVVYVSYPESSGERLRHYLRNARAEAAMVRVMLGPYLWIALLLGLIPAVHANRRQMWEFLPACIVLLSPFALALPMHVENRYVFVGMPPIIALSVLAVTTLLGCAASSNKWWRVALWMPLLLAISPLVRNDVHIVRSRPDLSVTTGLTQMFKENVPSGAQVLMPASQNVAAYLGGVKSMVLPYDPVDRTVAYARKSRIEYICVMKELHPHPSWIPILRRGDASSGIELVDELRSATLSASLFRVRDR